MDQEHSGKWSRSTTGLVNSPPGTVQVGLTLLAAIFTITCIAVIICLLLRCQEEGAASWFPGLEERYAQITALLTRTRGKVRGMRLWKRRDLTETRSSGNPDLARIEARVCLNELEEGCPVTGV